MFDLLDRLKRWFIDLVKSRVFVLMLVFIVLSTILIQRVFVLQIVNGQAYLDDYKLQIQKTKEVQGTRGRILDRNGVVLADNKLAYSVTIEDNGDYDTVKEKNKIINAKPPKKPPNINAVLLNRMEILLSMISKLFSMIMENMLIP